jgi:hypothetical protein
MEAASAAGENSVAEVASAVGAVAVFAVGVGNGQNKF